MVMECNVLGMLIKTEWYDVLSMVSLSFSLSLSLSLYRKGTVVNSTVLVFIAGSLMGFSRICGSPEMIIFGRFVTGIHSGIELIHGYRSKGTDDQETGSLKCCG